MLRIVMIALAVLLIPQNSRSHAPEFHGFKMVEFKPSAPAPDFSLPDVAGTKKGLKDFRGRYVLLNFWATWCAPCIREMPSLQKLEDRLRDQSLSVVAVSVDAPGDKSKVERFMRDLDLSFTVLLDSTFAVQNIYGANELPSTFLIDPNGEIIAAAKGERDWASAEAVSFFDENIRPQEASRR